MPEEWLDRPRAEPLLRDEPCELPRLTRWASTLAIGAAKTTTASAAKSVKKSFLGVNMSDLRLNFEAGQRKEPHRQFLA
jgi:hypothetical protein